MPGIKTYKQLEQHKIKKAVVFEKVSALLGLPLFHISTSNNPHPYLDQFQQVINHYFVVDSCYSLETQKCCECFANLDQEHGDGIYCVK